MSPSVSHKVVLVTGCSSGGIGSAICEEYASRGCKVYATARRLEAMDGFKHPVERLQLDVTDDKSVHEAVQTIIDREGRIDILVNNAGVLCTGPIIDIPMEEIQRAYDANVFSVIRMCKAVIPHMAARKSGTIVNISSIQAHMYALLFQSKNAHTRTLNEPRARAPRPTPWAGIYASSKAAMQSLTETLYMECTPLDISVVLVVTGAVRSNLAANRLRTFAGLPPDSLYTRYLPNILERTNMSQDADSIPTAEYARHVVDSSLKARPPRSIMLGGKTLQYRFLMCLPRSLALWILWRRLSRGAR